jgi:hypothetical protein
MTTEAHAEDVPPPCEIVLIVRGRVAQVGCFPAGLTRRGMDAAARTGEDVELFVLGPAAPGVPRGTFLTGDLPHYTTLEALRGEDSGPMVECILHAPVVRRPCRRLPKGKASPAGPAPALGGGPVAVHPNAGPTRLRRDPGCAACRAPLKDVSEYAERVHRFRSADGVAASFFYYCTGCAPTTEGR